MHVTNPQVFMLAESSVNLLTLRAMQVAIGAGGWEAKDVHADGELLVEVAGRLCYKSFSTELNANLTKVREGNREYIGNILKQHHGSVLEHATATFALINVSRILTHELVRHRAGTAFSQESMRFVRLDDIPIHIPDLRKEWEELKSYHKDSAVADLANYVEMMQASFEVDMRRVTERAEEAITPYASLLDRPGIPFGLKKKITSALRRMAPGGHTTNIIVTANHRAWRHMIEMRTSEGAEQEIREVFLEIAKGLFLSFPAFYQDMMIHPSGVCEFEHSKV